MAYLNIKFPVVDLGYFYIKVLQNRSETWIETPNVMRRIYLKQVILHMPQSETFMTYELCEQHMCHVCIAHISPKAIITRAHLEEMFGQQRHSIRSETVFKFLDIVS